MYACLCIYIAASMYIDIILQEYGQRGSFEKKWA